MKNRGQAAVEFILLIAVLTPILIFVLSSIKEGVFDKMGLWLKSEIACQVRYGYSCNYFKTPGVNVNDLSNTKGTTPLPYTMGPAAKQHPLGQVKSGWM